MQRHLHPEEDEVNGDVDTADYDGRLVWICTRIKAPLSPTNRHLGGSEGLLGAVTVVLNLRIITITGQLSVC